MANYPKKTIDPTEAALSAIQEALNIREDEEQPADRAESVSDFLAGAADGRQRPAPPPPAFDQTPDADAIGTRNLDTPTTRAANDDQQSIGQILHTLQRRPARTSYFVAAVFSAAWVVGCLALSWAYLSI